MVNESLVIKTKVADVVRAHNKALGGDFVDKLSNEVKIMIDKAVQRAADNGRQTVMGKDL